MTIESTDVNQTLQLQLTRGTALLIIGPQGCGKTALAQRIAGQHGTFQTISDRDLLSVFRFGNVMAEEPNTLIVEVDCQINARRVPVDLERIHELLNKPTILVERKMKWPIEVRAPHLIFCSEELANLATLQLPRYTVVDLAPTSTATTTASAH